MTMVRKIFVSLRAENGYLYCNIVKLTILGEGYESGGDW